MMRPGLFHRRAPLVLIPFVTLALSAQVALLNDSDPKRRAEAARKTGKEGTSQDIPALAELLDDPVREVRAEAVGAILRLDTQDSLEPLMRATRDATPAIQAMAVDGLVNFYYPGYVKSGWSASLKSFGSDIKGRFTEPEPKVVEAYVQRQVSADVVRAISRLITGGTSIESRANAARALGVLLGKQGMSQLVEGLRAKDQIIIVECIRSIRKIGDTEVGPELVFLVRDPDEDVQYETARTMGQLKVQEATPELVNLLNRSPRKRIRREALIAIAKISDPQQRMLFHTYLRDKDRQLRAAAAEGLGRLGNRDDLPMILDAFAREKRVGAFVDGLRRGRPGRHEFPDVSLRRAELEFSPSRSEALPDRVVTRRGDPAAALQTSHHGLQRSEETHRLHCRHQRKQGEHAVPREAYP